MGSICSKASAHSGGHTVLGSADVNQPGGSQRPANPRAAAAEAAERRQKAEQARGISSSNPKGGQLAAKLEASRTAPRVLEQRQEERLVVGALSDCHTGMSDRTLQVGLNPDVSHCGSYLQHAMHQRFANVDIVTLHAALMAVGRGSACSFVCVDGVVGIIGAYTLFVITVGAVIHLVRRGSVLLRLFTAFTLKCCSHLSILCLQEESLIPW
ncbi:hypothetical protein OBBRIDRAFT_718948 [Obba rivulosa]|uniref:Uncharacterized protein n=1 Tax=Obba rivulosa TaxID=1052685 RepID=A0A8E2DUN7_9APHY|nr:hypothetical protein OBBRIDRAFT_718948 [Obba rivulosa]